MISFRGFIIRGGTPKCDKKSHFWRQTSRDNIFGKGRMGKNIQYVLTTKQYFGKGRMEKETICAIHETIF